MRTLLLVQRIIKLVAGVEDEPPPRPARANGSSSSSSKRSDPSAEWVRQLERNFDSMSTSGSRGGGGAPQLSGSAMVDVVGYESVGGGGGASSSGRGGGGGGGYGSDLSYGQIAGGCVVRHVSGRGMVPGAWCGMALGCWVRGVTRS